MNLLRLSTAIAIAAAIAAPGLALPQTEEHEKHHPEAGAAAEAATPDAPADASGTAGLPDMAGPSSAGSGPQDPGMMGGDMMRMMPPEMMRMMHEMMAGRMPGRSDDSAPVVIIIPMPMAGAEMMQSGEIRPGMMMKPGMMAMMQGRGTGANAGGAASMDISGGQPEFASGVVTPAVHLSAADVRHFLEHRLDSDGNPRLAIGEVTETDDDIITAEIVTTDGSLVERLSIDRHSGRVARVR